MPNELRGIQKNTPEVFRLQNHYTTAKFCDIPFLCRIAFIEVNHKINCSSLSMEQDAVSRLNLLTRLVEERHFFSC